MKLKNVIIGTLAVFGLLYIGIIFATVLLTTSTVTPTESPQTTFVSQCVQTATSDGTVAQTTATHYCNCVWSAGVSQYGQTIWVNKLSQGGSDPYITAQCRWLTWRVKDVIPTTVQDAKQKGYHFSRTVTVRMSSTISVEPVIISGLGPTTKQRLAKLT